MYLTALPLVPQPKYKSLLTAFFTVTVFDTISKIAPNSNVVFIQKHLILCAVQTLCCEFCVCSMAHFPLFHVCLTVAAERDIVLEVSEHIKPEVKADLLEWVRTKCNED